MEMKGPPLWYSGSTDLVASWLAVYRWLWQVLAVLSNVVSLVALEREIQP